jgi:hypothetical protein
MENLQNFMLLFRIEPGNQQPTAEQLVEMQKQWGIFIGGIAAQAKLVSTSRLGFDGNLIDKNLNVVNSILITESKTLSGNMVIKATSINEATEIAKGCPVLPMGGSVEVRNILPMTS